MTKAKKLPSGNWRTQVYDYTDENSKKHYKSFTAASKKESEYKASCFALSKHDIDLSMTVGEAIQIYIDSKSKKIFMYLQIMMFLNYWIISKKKDILCI